MQIESMEIGMQITNMKRSEAERVRAYRQENLGRYRKRDAARKRASRANSVPTFIGVDTEGIGRGENHRAVLLGVGDQSYLAKDFDRGLQWQEVFEFLYSQFQKHPRAAFVGFYLRYDFNKWLESLPQHPAFMLFTREGKAQRKMHDKSIKNRRYSFPVREEGWEFDMLGYRRLSIRPRPIGCECFETKQKCTHKGLPWMHICDAGSFYQAKFETVISEKNWIRDPDGPLCTPEEYATVKFGKDHLRQLTQWDPRLVEYNQFENMLLARVMTRLAKGFKSVGITLAKDQWYGPGAAAAKWLDKNGGLSRKQLRQKDGKHPPLMPRSFWDASRNSYFGGWFEIFSHGVISGKSYNYDINNAYPYAAAKLPHICRECRYRRGTGTYNGRGNYVLLYATVFSKGTRIGAMPNRTKDGSILRPSVTKGWYWRFEIEAARRANLVKRVQIHAWEEFVPCDHRPPYTKIHDLYALRRKVTKASAQGMAIKNINTSIYGKHAQSVGTAPYNNWFYASYITAYCRAQILDAIATHPDKEDAVLMVATDGICFDSPHPSLPITSELGDWEASLYHDVCLFKPGVYWHKDGKEALLKVKSRGVPREEFEKQIVNAEAGFKRFTEWLAYYDKREWLADEMNHYEVYSDQWYSLMLQYTWPRFEVPVNFRMKSCSQALNEGKWESAGRMQEKVMIKQDSHPHTKRRDVLYNPDKDRLDTYIYDLPVEQRQTKYHQEIKPPKHRDLGFDTEGSVKEQVAELIGVIRDKPANYDVLMDQYEWETVWDGSVQ